MSQKPFDFQNALSQLKTVSPSRVPAAIDVAKPARRFPYRTSAIGLAAALAAAIFWPRAESGIAWAQVLDTNKGTQRIHVINYWRDGHKTLEWWRDGERYTYLSYAPGSMGKSLFMETRCDGEHVIHVNHDRKPRNGWRRLGKKEKAVPAEGFEWGGALVGSTSNIVDDIIQRKVYKLLDERTVDTAEGPRVRFRLSRASRFTIQKKTKTVTTSALVFVDPKTRLIQTIQYVDGKDNPLSKAVIEYPNQIEDSVFKLNTTDVDILDVDKDRKVVAQIIRRGLGSQTVKGQTVTLRSVLFDGAGALWILWSGNLPHGSLPHLVRIEGYPSPKVVPNVSFPMSTKAVLNAYSYKSFTANATERRSKVLPSINARLGGMAVGMRYQVLSQIDLVVPVLDATGKKKLGEAKFRNVPVHRIFSLFDYREQLGMQ